MSIEVLNIVLPNAVLSAAVTGTRMRQNTRTVNVGGYASVNTDRDLTLRRFQLATVPLMSILASSIIGIYEATKAGTYGFLMEDPVDSTATVTEGALQGYTFTAETGAPGFGNGTPNYGFRKLYTAAGSALSGGAVITRPRTPAIFRGGSPVTVGVAAGNVALSAGAVYATFVPDATRAVSSITTGATTVVTLGSAIPIIVNGRLWLQGVTGSAATLLNNQAHLVTAVAGAVYTIATNTAGTTAVTGAAQGHKYPQPDESLMWSGGYYMPVHFRDDDLEWSLLAGGTAPTRMVTFTACYVDEIRE